MFARHTRQNRNRSITARAAAKVAARLSDSSRRGMLIEALEERRLFTTLHAGDTFTYNDLAGTTFTIKVGPGVTAEVVGATVAGGNATVVDKAGALNGAPVNGGPGVS